MIKREHIQGGEGVTPQQRTEIFFGWDYSIVTEALRGKIVAVDGMPRAIRIDATKGWSIVENNGIYRRGFNGVTVDTIGDGNVWAFPDRRFHTTVPLIGAQQDGQKGACVQIRAASKFVRETRQFVPLKNQREIAEYLKLGSNEVAALEFHDNTDILHLVRHEENPDEVPEEKFVDSTDSNNYFRELLGE